MPPPRPASDLASALFPAQAVPPSKKRSQGPVEIWGGCSHRAAAFFVPCPSPCGLAGTGSLGYVRSWCVCVCVCVWHGASPSDRPALLLHTAPPTALSHSLAVATFAVATLACTPALPTTTTTLAPSAQNAIRPLSSLRVVAHSGHGRETVPRTVLGTGWVLSESSLWWVCGTEILVDVRG